jgi:hypothetical protein
MQIKNLGIVHKCLRTNVSDPYHVLDFDMDQDPVHVKVFLSSFLLVDGRIRTRKRKNNKDLGDLDPEHCCEPKKPAGRGVGSVYR